MCVIVQVSIVGRPNVGKSALFNRLVKKRQAIVRDTPHGHVTRDYQEGRGRLSDLEFLAIDTSGLEPYYPENSIQMRATSLTRDVLLGSDVILFLLDGKDGVLASDQSLATWFRSSGEDVIGKILTVVNKCERGAKTLANLTSEVPRLGFGDFIAISAETGEGMADLYAGLRQKLDIIVESRLEAMEALGHEVVDTDSYSPNTKVAIMGLTNVGKSTLMNSLIGSQRCLTGPEPGLTRDAITTQIDFDGETMELIDTAGWIKKTQLKAHDDSEGAVAEMTMREGKTVLRFVHVVVLLVDYSRILQRRAGLTHAEASLAADAVAQGRGLIVCLNKVDTAEHGSYTTALRLVQKDLQNVAPEIGFGDILPISALEGTGVQSILPAVQRVYKTWNHRIPTGKLNAWLKKLTEQKIHEGGGKNIQRIKYVSQVKARPPTFVAFVSGRASLDDATCRFLSNSLRHDFKMDGVPLRITVRPSKRRQ